MWNFLGWNGTSDECVVCLICKTVVWIFICRCRDNLRSIGEYIRMQVIGDDTFSTKWMKLTVLILIETAPQNKHSNTPIKWKLKTTLERTNKKHDVRTGTHVPCKLLKYFAKLPLLIRFILVCICERSSGRRLEEHTSTVRIQLFHAPG